MANKQKIQISRSAYIETSRSVAVLRLNDYEFLPGEIVSLRYYKDADVRNNIGVIVAIGIKEGTGEDCYRIISHGGEVPVAGVVETIPDVSELVHGEIFIYNNDGVWSYVYLRDLTNTVEDERAVDPIPTDQDFIFLDINDGYRYFYRKGYVNREDDFYTVEDTKEVLLGAINEDVAFTAESLTGYLFKSGTSAELTIQVSAKNIKTGEEDPDCTFWINELQYIPDSVGIITYSSVSSDTALEVECRKALGEGLYLSYWVTLDIRFGYTFYYGAVEYGWTPDASKIQNLENSKLGTTSIVFDWNKFDVTDQVLVIAYPSKLGGLLHIYDNHGIDYIKDYSKYTSIATIGDLSYTCYVLNKAFTATNFRQKYSFKEDITSVSTISSSGRSGSGSITTELNEAWENRNEPTGLVTLDENGKVPTTLLPTSGGGGGEGNGIIHLAGTSENMPTNMELGEIYYIISLDKLVTATTESSGELSTPSSEVIYYDLSRSTLYHWAENSGMGVVGSLLDTSAITDITEIL